MSSLKCISHQELPATTWTRIDGNEDRVNPLLIETIYVTYVATVGAAKTYRIALVLAGESTTPVSKNYLYIDNSLNPGQTSVKEVDLGLRPGDRLYAYASSTEIVMSVFGTQS